MSRTAEESRCANKLGTRESLAWEACNAASRAALAASLSRMIRMISSPEGGFGPSGGYSTNLNCPTRTIVTPTNEVEVVHGR